jgi:hypothetical protein
MNGLMIEIARRMTTHPDDDFVINLDNVRFLTGMSNSVWEKEFKESVPHCFIDKIFHHGQLGRADLLKLRDSLIFIDEIDTGDKEGQVLHQTLKDAGLMNIDYMKKNNIRFIVASASIIRELYSLYPWGDLHKPFTMTIPANYIGHYDFLKRGIIKEFYPLITLENVEQWIQEDILDNYGTDFRVHIVRVNARTVTAVQNACIRKGVKFHNHTSTDKLSSEDIKELFEDTLTEHRVVAVKGLWRRANLFTDSWKIRIGATHELWTKKVDSNVQNQGLPGRLTGYWRSVIEGGHKTGPYRTSIKAIEESEEAFKNPFGASPFTAHGFHKTKRGKVSMKKTMLDHEHWKVEKPVDLPKVEGETTSHLEEFASMELLIVRWRQLSSNVSANLDPPDTRDGIYICSIGGTTDVQTCDMIRERVGGTSIAHWGSGYTSAINGAIIHRVYVGYDTTNIPIFFLRWAIKGC